MKPSLRSCGTSASSRDGIVPGVISDNNSRGYVPRGYADQWVSVQTPELAEHLKWMGQKSLLSQDMYLMGPPGPLKRRLALTMAELCGWEVEYIQLSKDTTESDIKQRREIVGSSSVFVDQGPVRAAENVRMSKGNKTTLLASRRGS